MGTRSPIKGMNSIALIREDRLLLVIANRIEVTTASGISPIIGIDIIGAAI